MGDGDDGWPRHRARSLNLSIVYDRERSTIGGGGIFSRWRIIIYQGLFFFFKFMIKMDRNRRDTRIEEVRINYLNK